MMPYDVDFDEVFGIATSLSCFVLYVGGNSGRTMHSSSPRLETIHKGCCSAVNDIGILHTRMGRRKLEWRYPYYCTGSLSRTLGHKIKIFSFPRLYSPSNSQKGCCYLAATYIKEFSFFLVYSLPITRNFEWIYLMLRYIHYRCSITTDCKLRSKKTTAFSPFTGCNFCGFVQKNWQPLCYFKSVPVGIVTLCVWV